MLAFFMFAFLSMLPLLLLSCCCCCRSCCCCCYCCLLLLTKGGGEANANTKTNTRHCHGADASSGKRKGKSNGKSGEGVGGLLTCCSRWQVLSIEKTKCNRSKGSLKSTSSNRNNGVSNIMEKMPKWVDLYNRTGCHGLRIRQRSHGHTWQGLER